MIFKLESNRIKREFKITDGGFFASQILNKYSGMSLVPDGNGTEFVVHFADGSEFSSKRLAVEDSYWNDNKLCVVFMERCGVVVKLEYWVHNDGNTLCKQLTLSQNTDAVIDYVILENIGIINSKTHFSVDVVDGSEIPAYQTILGQPFYIDSLFFGCEFPATDNRIKHGSGRVKYYVGKSVGTDFACPVTVIGAGEDNTLNAVKKAFFEYIDSISQNVDLHFQYNSWFDYMRDINEQNLLESFKKVHDKLEQFGAPKLASYVVDDGWQNEKAGFWTYNLKKFPNEVKPIVDLCKEMDSHFGMWLGPRGGYLKQDKVARRIQRAGNGYYNKDAYETCVASQKYVDKLADFFVEQTQKYDMNYWKFDGFALKPCHNAKHDHAVGGENDMYFVTDLWHKWINVYNRLREVKPDIWINMTCYVNVSPWWLQWVNSMWVQNSADISFADNYNDQLQVDAEITYRDGRYYDCVCTRALQFPLKGIYNHEPVYGNCAKVNYTDEEFEKFIYWHAVRGQALNELYISESMMSDAKWKSLADVMNFQKDNYHILKNASFIGGNPVENNIYGYVAWTEDGEGIVALRNPSKEKTSMTLTFNKLMGAPECLSNAWCENVYSKSIPLSDKLYSYNDKMDLTLNPFEIVIFKFTK